MKRLFPLLFSGWLCLSGQSSFPQGSVEYYYALDAESFFSLSASQAGIDLTNPDTLLLDAAVFHATNEARQKAGLSPFRFNHSLYQAAIAHAEAMIDFNFYSHANPYSPIERMAVDRIQRRGDAFTYTAENIAQIRTIETPEEFCDRYLPQQDRYEYVHCTTHALLKPFSYARYARQAVRNWMNSPQHHATLVSALYSHLGCSVRLSKQPYKERRAPFGRLVQNFGGY